VPLMVAEMVDIYSPLKRSTIMASVRYRNTKPELVVRRTLHSMGYRFRLHSSALPGRPDVVLPRHRKVVFINGCFWHQHDGCKRASVPKTRTLWWREKLRRNVDRDRRVRHELSKAGWRVLDVWSCEIRDDRDLERRLEKFMRSKSRGRANAARSSY
jgi:DNA mismatch endonuclease (patch repair protein)